MRYNIITRSGAAAHYVGIKYYMILRDARRISVCFGLYASEQAFKERRPSIDEILIHDSFESDLIFDVKPKIDILATRLIEKLTSTEDDDNVN